MKTSLKRSKPVSRKAAKTLRKLQDDWVKLKQLQISHEATKPRGIKDDEVVKSQNQPQQSTQRAQRKVFKQLNSLGVLGLAPSVYEWHRECRV